MTDMADLMTQCVNCAQPVYDAAGLEEGQWRRLFDARTRTSSCVDIKDGQLVYELVWSQEPHQCAPFDVRRLADLRQTKSAIEIRLTYPNAIVYDEGVFKPYSVKCPKCDAEAGEKCRNLNPGYRNKTPIKRNKTAHQERNFAAIDAAGLKVVRKGSQAFLVSKAGKGK